ncbi:zinc finger protein 638 isoform X3 [Esox lucius]|uniref:zinc finger protein 638 isoform X3 n=1 Tax=Esox lucius TaxID=8010 RepID=UPI0014774148|nr:zinc finger protein 638 isoform X3 [Esox lucius]
MQKNTKKNRVKNTGQQQRAPAFNALTKQGNHFALLTDSRSPLLPSICFRGGAADIFATSSQGAPFLSGPAAALHLAQIEAQLILRQLTAITVASNLSNQQLALLHLLQTAAAANNKSNVQPLASIMYQQQGAPFNRPRAMPFRPQQPGHVMGANMPQMNNYPVGRFPPPTHLPEKQESAISVCIQGGRHEDIRLTNQMTQISRQHCADPHLPGGGQSHRSETGYSNSSNLIPLSSDNQPYQRQDLEWSEYQTPNNVFAPNQQQQRQQPQQLSHPHANPNPRPPGGGAQNWNVPVSDQGRPQGGDMQNMYVPESAGSILASFGLSNDDLEFLSHYPDDQLTPDTLPLILRDIKIQKTTRTTDPPPTFSENLPPFSDRPPPPRLSLPQLRPALPRSPDIPSFLSVAQIAGKVIDYGHASRAAEEGRDSFKREPLPKESPTKAEYKQRKAESPGRRRSSDGSPHVQKYRENKDYKRRTPSPGAPKHKRALVREPPPTSRSERDVPRMKPSSEARSDSLKSARPSESKHISGAHKSLPTPTMISDFSADPPKVYPHTCSLCETQCEREKDWTYHVNTVNHTASCRDLRNRYPGWKPDLPRKGSEACSTWRSLDRSASRSVSRSLSCSPTPPPDRRKRASPPTSVRRHRESHSPRHPLQPPHGHGHRPSGRYSPLQSRRGPTGVSTSRGLKRSSEDTAKRLTGSSSQSSGGRSSTGKSGNHPSLKVAKPGDKPAVGKEAAPGQSSEKTLKPTPKLQKKQPPGSCLLYLTGLPADAKYQEVVSLVQAFGKVDNVLIVKSEEPAENQGPRQYAHATVCMHNEQEAKVLAACCTLSIRDHPITVSDKEPEDTTNSSIPVIIKGHVEGASKTTKDPSNINSTIESPETSVVREKIKERGVVKIAGLPKGDCLDLEGEITKLAEPYGTPVKILVITDPKEAVVTMPDVESAQEMLKAYDKTPALINDSVLNMMPLPPNLELDLNRPVALFQSLMGPRNPASEAEAADDWKCLLVVNNVPQTPSGPTEVRGLVKRFGTVQQALALKDMIIFEMETADMAQKVFNRFQTYPCIIQNNPLSFTWKPDPVPDPEANTLKGDISAGVEAVGTTPADEAVGAPDQSVLKVETRTGEVGGKNPGDEEEEEEEEGGEVKTELQEVATALEGTDEKPSDTALNQVEVTAPNTEVLPRGQSGGEVTDKVLNILTADSDKDKQAVALGSTRATPSATTGIKCSEVPVSGPSPTVMAAVIEALRQESRNRSSASSKNTTEKTPADKPTDKQTPVVQPPPALPKVTPEILKALLEECRARSSSRANAEHTKKDKEPVPPAGQKADAGRERVAKRKTHDEERESERKQREKRRKVQEEKVEKERREREKRQCQREGSSGSAKSRSEGSRPSGRSPRSESRRGYGENRTSPVLQSNKQQVEEGEEVGEETTPFDLEDFVTLDEVEDVAEVITKDATESREPTGHDATTTSALETESQADPTPAEAADPGNPVELGEKDQEKESSGSPATTEEQSVKTEEGTGVLEAENVPELRDDRTELVATVPKTTCDEVTEASDVKGPIDATPADIPAVSGKEEEEEKDSPEMKGKSKSQEESEETVKKKIKLEPLFHEDYTIPPFTPDCPVGMEFLVPKSGFFCKVCSKFYSGTDEAKKNHCKSLKHYQNLEKSLDKWRAKKEGSSMAS